MADHESREERAFISSETRSMGYLFEYGSPAPPEHIVSMSPAEFMAALSINLSDAADKIDSLSHRLVDENGKTDGDSSISITADIFRELSECPKDAMTLRLVRSLLKQINVLNPEVDPTEGGQFIPVESSD